MMVNGMGIWYMVGNVMESVMDCTVQFGQGSSTNGISSCDNQCGK